MGKRDYGQMKRILAFLLCVAIFTAFTPASVFAQDNENAEAATEKVVLQKTDPDRTAPDTTSEDPDALLEGYMDKQIKEELGSAPASKDLKRKAAIRKRRETLTDGEKIIYDGIKEAAERIASGSESSSIAAFDISGVFSSYYEKKTMFGSVYNVVTSQSLGISSGVYVKTGTYWTFSDEAKAKLYDFDKVLHALMADEPYVFYWFDKTEGVEYEIDGLLLNISGSSSDLYFPEGTAPVFKASLAVSEGYSAGGAGSYTVDTSKTGATATAAAKAAEIIKDNASASDFDKLSSYKNKICELTEYNDAATDPAHPYGDPWQLIYVFDDDSTTNVVCEGYSKAFQYLCDHSDFEGGIECDSVTGTMTAGSGEGDHMWNILHMEDGKNYLADVTNSDSGMIGSRGGLFLSPALTGGSVSGGYSFRAGASTITYVYDDDTRGIFSDSELTMAESEYIVHEHELTDIAYEWAEDGSSCTAHATCASCGESITRKAVVTSSVKKEASCTEDGVTVYTATFRQNGLETQTKEIESPAYGHRYKNVVTVRATAGRDGLMTHTCSVCGDTYTSTIPAIRYPVILPAVNMAKPKAGTGRMTVLWTKVSLANQKKIQGIEIQIATDPFFKNIVKTEYADKDKRFKVIRGLRSNTIYYVRVRTYNNSCGKLVSVWKSKNVKVN